MGLKGQAGEEAWALPLKVKQWALALGRCLWVLIARIPALVRLANTGGVAHVILITPPSTSGGYEGDQTSTGLKLKKMLLFLPVTTQNILTAKISDL